MLRFQFDACAIYDKVVFIHLNSVVVAKGDRARRQSNLRVGFERVLLT
jgi:hypothetical protein